MAIRWGWTRARQGRDVPAFKIRIEYAIDLTQVEELLLSWAIDRLEWVGDDGKRSFPATVAMPEIEEIVRDQLRRKGKGGFEGYWGDDLSRGEIDQARDWAGKVLKSLFPEEFAQTWTEGK